MSTGKRILITVIVSVVLIGIISFLMYVIYIFGFYNKNEVSKMTYSFNSNDFEFVYDNLTDKLDKETYDRIISIMYDKSTLKDIYYLYYSKSDYNIGDFYKEFYFGDKNVSNSDISYNYDGKTNLFKRSKITYNYINVSNKNGSKSSVGIINNVTLNVDNNSELYLDGNKCECDSNKCIYKKIYGGIHEIKYVNNNITYYGLLNVVSNDSTINISTLDSLVRINEKTELKTVKDASLSTVKPGIYNMDRCYMSESCANKKKSYLYIFDDNKVEMYLYNSFEAAGNYFYGEWSIDEDNIIFKFDKHVYSLYDYDSREITNIDAEIDMTKKYQILDDETIKSDEYKFYFIEEFKEEEEEVVEE